MAKQIYGRLQPGDEANAEVRRLKAQIAELEEQLAAAIQRVQAHYGLSISDTGSIETDNQGASNG